MPLVFVNQVVITSLNSTQLDWTATTSLGSVNTPLCLLVCIGEFHINWWYFMRIFIYKLATHLSTGDVHCQLQNASSCSHWSHIGSGLELGLGLVFSCMSPVDMICKCEVCVCMLGSCDCCTCRLVVYWLCQSSVCLSTAWWTVSLRIIIIIIIIITALSLSLSTSQSTYLLICRLIFYLAFPPFLFSFLFLPFLLSLPPPFSFPYSPFCTSSLHHFPLFHIFPLFPLFHFFLLFLPRYWLAGGWVWLCCGICNAKLAMLKSSGYVNCSLCFFICNF